VNDIFYLSMQGNSKLIEKILENKKDGKMK
jgi:hypothetical protein